MNDFTKYAKEIAFFCLRYFWVLILAVVVFYLLYQTTFSYSAKDVDVVANNELEKEEDVIFVTIEDSFIGKKDEGFGSLSESLEVFDFDKKNDLIYFKYNNLLPYTVSDYEGDSYYNYSPTKIIIVYDKGKDSFAHFTEVVSLSTFPYTYYFEDEKLFTVEGIDKDGTVFLNYNQKTIKLSQNEDYSKFSFDKLQLTKTSIVNHGIYNKKQFLQLKTENEILKEEKQKEKEQKEKEEKRKEEGTDEKFVLPNIHNVQP